ncbi:MAG: putative lipid II flippase FtsW [Candidatus Eremiobacteraeota bacterium]|nr:putative lipid II flippase FtsW [Candidatus Eremiobacteraeota bacterium]
MLFLPALGLMAYGVVMVFSASCPTAALSPICNFDPYFFLKRHVLWLLIGFVAMIFAYKIDLKKWRKYSLIIILITLALLFTVLIFGETTLGATRRLKLGPITFQPSEFAKIALVFFLADALARRRNQVRNFKKLLSVLVIFAIVGFLIEKQPDLGTTIVVGSTTLAMLFLAGANIFHLIGMTLVGLLVAVSRILDEPYRIRRILAFLNPWEDSAGMGYQNIQSYIALGSGGLYGVGLGESRQKFFYLPEKFTDFIFAITGEELGFYYGTLPIVILFILFLVLGFRIAMKTRDPFMSLLAGGITFMITFQAFINMGVVSGILPCTGITLPFISFGGSSLVFTLFSLGMLLNIAGQPKKKGNKLKQLEKRRPRFGPRESAEHDSIVIEKAENFFDSGEIESGEIDSEEIENVGALSKGEEPGGKQCESSSQEEEPEDTYTPQ